MEENMNYEVTTEVEGCDDVTTEITIEESSRPSKTFVALVAGGIAAAVVGTVIAVKKFKKHKKKKAAEKEIEDDAEFEVEDFNDEDLVDVEPEETEKK